MRLPFIAIHWCLMWSLAVFLIAEVFILVIVMTKAIACIWKSLRMVVFSCLYPSWSISIPDLKDTVVRDLLYIVKSSNDSACQHHFVSPNLKLFYICNEAVWFWEQSYLSWKFPRMCWKYSLLPSWNKFEINMLRIRVYLFLTHSKLTPMNHRFSWLWNILLSPATGVRFLTRKDNHPPCISCSSFCAHSKN